MPDLPPRDQRENTGRAKSLIRQKYCQCTRVSVRNLSFLVGGQALSPYFPTDLQWMPDCVTSNSHVRFFSLGPQQTVEAPIFCNVLFGAALVGFTPLLPKVNPLRVFRKENRKKWRISRFRRRCHRRHCSLFQSTPTKPHHVPTLCCIVLHRP